MNVVYNGVDLQFLLTKNITCEPQYTEDGMDYLYTRVTLVCQGLLTLPSFEEAGVVALRGRGAQLPEPFHIKAGETIAGAIVRLENRLNAQRGRLTIEDTKGGVLIDVDGSTDVHGGPTPKHVTVSEIVGSGSCVVNFTVECNVQRLCEKATSPPLYQSHRWTETIVIDENQMAKRVRQGKIYTRRDALMNADALRGLSFHPIPKGFKRITSEYTIQTDGMALNYTHVDQEQYLMPSESLTKQTGEYIETSTDGASRWGEVRLTVSGKKNTPKITLLSVAVSQALSKLRSAGLIELADAKNENTAGWQAITVIKEDLFNPTITLSIKARLSPYAPPGKSREFLIKDLERKRSKALREGNPVIVGLVTDLWSSDDAKAKAKDLTRLINHLKKLPKESDSALELFRSVRQDLKDTSRNRQDTNATPYGTSGLSLISAALQDPCLALTIEQSLKARAKATPSVGLDGGRIQPPPDDGIGSKTGGGGGGSGNPDTPRTVLPGGSSSRSSDLQPARVEYAEEIDDPTEPIETSAWLAGGVYNDYRVRVRWEDDEGVIALPGVGEDADVAYPKLWTKPLVEMVVEWTSERAGEPPVIPAKTSANTNLVYKKGETEVGQLDRTSSGTLKYRISGRYRYGVKNASKIKYYAPVPPWLIDLERSVIGSVAGAAAATQVKTPAMLAAEAIASKTSSEIVRTE